MAISEDEVAHKANRPSAQVHLHTETTKLILLLLRRVRVAVDMWADL